MPISRRRTLPPKYAMPPSATPSPPASNTPKPKTKGQRCTKNPDNCAEGLVCKKTKFTWSRYTCQPESSSKKKGRSPYRTKSVKINLERLERQKKLKERQKEIGLGSNSPVNETVESNFPVTKPVKNNSPSEGEYLRVNDTERQPRPGENNVEYMYVNGDPEGPGQVKLLNRENNYSPEKNRDKIFLENTPAGLGGPLDNQAQSPHTGQKKRRAKKSSVNKNKEKKGPTKKERKSKASRKKKGN